MPNFFIFVKKTTSLAGTFIFDQVQKFCSSKKLQLIEGCYQASIWAYFVQHSIAESMEIATSDWAFPLIPLCNDDQNISRSMQDCNIQFVVTFFSIKIFELGKKWKSSKPSVVRTYFVDFRLNAIPGRQIKMHMLKRNYLHTSTNPRYRFQKAAHVLPLLQSRIW